MFPKCALTKQIWLEHFLFNELGLNKQEAKELIDIFFEEIRLALENNQPVKLSGFVILTCAINVNVRVVTKNRRRNSHYCTS